MEQWFKAVLYTGISIFVGLILSGCMLLLLDQLPITQVAPVKWSSFVAGIPFGAGFVSALVLLYSD